MRSTNPIHTLCLAAFAATLAGCASQPDTARGFGHGGAMKMMTAGGDTGYVVRPHISVGGYATVKLRVLNTQLGASRAVEWRYKRANGPWSIFLDQGDTAAGLAPGSSYAVNFKMKSASSPHRAPDNEPADLSETEKETLFVRWQH